MIGFWIAASAMIAAALALVLPPLIGRVRAPDRSRDDVNLAIYRERREELEAERAAGTVDEEQFEAARAELDRELLRDVGDLGEGDDAGAAQRSPFPAVAIAVALPLIAFGLYLQIGTPSVLLEGVAGAPGSAGAASQASGQGGQSAEGQIPHSVEEMVARLEQRMRENPEDPEGWVVLGRSYAAMNRLEDARAALAEADRRRPDHPLTLVAYAEVLAGLNDNRLDGEPMRLIERALEIQPQFARALWLAGVYAFNQGERAKALDYWQRILAIPGLSPEAVAQVSDAVAQAGGTPAAGAGAAAAPAPVTTAPAAGTPAGAALTVNVSLSPQLASRIDGSETLFVFARAAQGPRMPLAIARHRVTDLPLTVTLDDSMAMAPQMTLSRFDRVVVSARVSRSGSATPASGDLQGSSAPLSPTAGAPLDLVIDQVIE